MFCTGCGNDGPQRLAVSGSVDWQGEDVAAGSITFVPTDGNTGPSASSAVTDGSYEFNSENGPVAGKNRVIITFVPSKGSAMFQQKAAQKRGEQQDSGDPLMNYEDPESVIDLGPDDDAEDANAAAPASLAAGASKNSSNRRGNAWEFSVELSEKDSLQKDFTLQ